MADKTPLRAVFNDSSIATGLAEFQSGDTIPVTHGGTGLSSLGSALQILRVNSAGNALEFAAAAGSLAGASLRSISGFVPLLCFCLGCRMYLCTKMGQHLHAGLSLF